MGDVRVKVLSVSHSENVTVAGVTLSDGHGWTTRFVNCTNLLVSHVDVFGDWRMPNNDGLDPNSCTNVTFEHVDVNVADDAISPKATLKLPDGGYLPMRGLTVRHARLRSRSFAVKLGTEIYGDMEDLLFEDLRVYSSHEGLGIDLRERGDVRNVTFRRVNIDRAYWAGSGGFARQNWMGNAQPIFVSNGKAFGPVRPRGTISGVLFEDVTAVGENGVYVSGLPAAPGMERGSIHDVVFRDVRVLVQQLPRNNATNGPHPAHSDRQESAAAGGAGGEPVDAFFVEHATGVAFEGACAAAFAGRHGRGVGPLPALLGRRRLVERLQGWAVVHVARRKKTSRVTASQAVDDARVVPAAAWARAVLELAATSRDSAGRRKMRQRAVVDIASKRWRRPRFS